MLLVVRVQRAPGAEVAHELCPRQALAEDDGARVRQRGVVRAGEEDALERAELALERLRRVGDVEEVVVEDRAPWTLPVRSERVLGIGALRVCVDEGGGGGVAREAELRVTLRVDSRVSV